MVSVLSASAATVKANNDETWVEINSDVQGSLLTNDLAGQQGAQIAEISVETNDADAYISQLNGVDATADLNGTTVHIRLPDSGEDVEINTPLGATLSVNSAGDYNYDIGDLSANESESFGYTLQDAATGQVSSAEMTINVVAEPNSLLTLMGTNGADVLTTANKNVNTIVMQGGEGIDEFVIDLSKNDAPETVFVKDLGIHGANKLTFINVDDEDQDGESTFADAVESFSQDGENGNVEVTLQNDTTLIFENIGTVQGNDVQALQAHLESIAAEVNIHQ